MSNNNLLSEESAVEYNKKMSLLPDNVREILQDHKNNGNTNPYFIDGYLKLSDR